MHVPGGVQRDAESGDRRVAQQFTLVAFEAAAYPHRDFTVAIL